MNFKYTYHVGNNKVVCLAKYAGKPVRGIAKCDVSADVFDEETGKKLAKLRCKEKLDKKRLLTARQKFENATLDLIKARSDEEYFRSCYETCLNDYAWSQQELKRLEQKLANS